MTMTVESVIARLEPWRERIEPVARKVYEIGVSAVTFCSGVALTLAGVGFAILVATQLRLPDAVLLLQDGRHPPQPVSDIRDGLLFLIALAVGVLIWGLHVLHDWKHPHLQQAKRIAALESQLVEVRQFAVEAEDRDGNFIPVELPGCGKPS
jgi:hypothetical protein